MEYDTPTKAVITTPEILAFAHIHYPNTTLIAYQLKQPESSDYSYAFNYDTMHKLSAICTHNTSFFGLSIDGALYKIDARPSAQPSPNAHAIEDKNMIVQLHVHEELKSFDGKLDAKEFKTADGLVFWFITPTHILVRATSTMQIIARDIVSFDLVDQAAVCLTTNGTTKLISCVSRPWITNLIPGTIQYLLITPAMGYVWFRLRNGMEFLRGYPLDNNPLLHSHSQQPNCTSMYDTKRSIALRAHADAYKRAVFP
jgi:hypothetical protein